MFKFLADIWTTIDQSTYHPFEFKSRKLQRIKDDVLKFIRSWIENKNIARGDYLELVELSVLFLGGANLGKKTFTSKSRVAFHHARWIAKVIYTLKIALFQTQLVKMEFVTQNTMDGISSLASFLSPFYVKTWYTASDTTDAPIHD